MDKTHSLGARRATPALAAAVGVDITRNVGGKPLANILWDCIGLVVIAAREAMDWLKAAAKVAAKGDMPVSWTTPAGFPVLQEYRAGVGGRVETHVAGRAVHITCNVEGTKLDSRRQALGISPNFVHSCDASHMMLSVCTALDNGSRAALCRFWSIGSRQYRHAPTYATASTRTVAP